MTTFTAPIVGQFHRPPAKTILEYLPSGAELLLIPEPENEYDSNAIKVLIADDAILNSPAVETMSANLPLQGFTLEQVLSECPIQLGYVAKTGGNPLAKAQERERGLKLVGNAEVLDLMKDPDYRATLVFGPSGAPLVSITNEPLAEQDLSQLEDEDEEVEKGDDGDLQD